MIGPLRVNLHLTQFIYEPLSLLDKDKELEKERHKKEGLGTFYTLPHYVKLYETFKGAYSNYKVSYSLLLLKEKQ